MYEVLDIERMNYGDLTKLRNKIADILKEEKYLKIAELAEVESPLP